MSELLSSSRVVNSAPQVSRGSTTDQACDVTNVQPGKPYMKKVGRSKQYVFDDGQPKFEGQVVLRWTETLSADYFMYVVVNIDGELAWARADLNEPSGEFSVAGTPFDPIRDK